MWFGRHREAMNRKQRIVIGVGTLLFLLAGLFPPWQGSLFSSSGYQFILDATRPIDLTQLFVEWAIIVGVVVGLSVLFHERP